MSEEDKIRAHPRLIKCKRLEATIFRMYLSPLYLYTYARLTGRLLYFFSLNVFFILKLSPR